MTYDGELSILQRKNGIDGGITWSFRALKLWSRDPRSWVWMICPGSTSDNCGSANEGFLIPSYGLSGCIVKVLSFFEVMIAGSGLYRRGVAQSRA